MATKAAARPVWEKAFLAALRKGATVAQAAETGGIKPGTAYSLRGKNARFAAEWSKAWAAGGRAPRAKNFTRVTQWKKPFLQALAETSNVSASAARVNIPTATVYQTRRDDPAFATRWRAALYEGYEHLEMEVLAYLRGTDGERKLDTANAIRLLAAHRQTVAEIRAIREDEDEQAVLDSIDALIDRMRNAPASAAEEPADGQRA
ncbi:MAG: hypothetical protein ACEQR8_10400 [Cypionkella sp.]